MTLGKKCGLFLSAILLGCVGLSSAATNDVAHFTPTKTVKNVFGGVALDGATSLYYSAGDNNEIYNVTQSSSGTWGSEVALSADGTTNLVSSGGAVYKSTAVGDPFGVAVLADSKVTLYGSTGSTFASKVWDSFSLATDTKAIDIAIVSATAGDVLLAVGSDCTIEIYKLAEAASGAITATEGTAFTLSTGLTSCSSISAAIDTSTDGWIFLTGNTGFTLPTYGTFAADGESVKFTALASSFLPLLEADLAFGSAIVSSSGSPKLFGTALNSAVDTSSVDYNVAFTSPFELATGGLSAKLSPSVSGTSSTPFSDTTVLSSSDCATSVSLGDGTTESLYAQLAFNVATGGGYNVTFVSANEQETLSFVYTAASSARNIKIDRTAVVGSLLTPSTFTSESITTTQTGDLNVIVDRHFVEFDAEAGGVFGAVAISRTNPFTKICFQAADDTNAVSVLNTSKLTYVTASNPNGAASNTLSAIAASLLGVAAAAALLL